ncbi:MAG: amidohydrolase family protein [Ktedonobacteraceae bacterium]|nr:amidohydrolase family protein [Ktedonobacteraceae bacterium]
MSRASNGIIPPHSREQSSIIVDSHIHALPPLVMTTYRAWLAETHPANEGPPHLWTSPAFEQPDEQIRALDVDGVAKALITFSSNAPAAMHVTALTHNLKGPEMVRMVNDQVITWAKASNGRLLPTAWIEPRFGSDALAEMERVVQHSGVQAISVLTAYRGPGQPLRFLDHPMFLPVLEYAATLKVPVYIHSSGRFNVFADMADCPLPEPAATYLTGGLSMLVESTLCLIRLVVNGVFDRLPDLRLVFGQLGGLFPFVLGRFDVIYELVVAATAKSGTDEPLEEKQVFGICRRLRDYAGQIYVDTHSMDQAAILCALESLGPDRVLYGSDFPVTPARIGRKEALDTLRLLPVSQDVKAAVLGKNAMALLCLDSLEESVSK